MEQVNYNTVSVTIQIIILVTSVIGSAIASFIIVKVALAENRKDIGWLVKQIDELEKTLRSHIDGPFHPTRDQIIDLANDIAELKASREKSHDRLERKIDALTEYVMRK